MGKKKVTWYIDEDVLRGIRVSAARRGIRDSEVVEEAVKLSTPWGIAERIANRVRLSENAAMKLAYDELHAMRAERDGA